MGHDRSARIGIGRTEGTARERESFQKEGPLLLVGRDLCLLLEHERLAHDALPDVLDVVNDLQEPDSVSLASTKLGSWKATERTVSKCDVAS